MSALAQLAALSFVPTNQLAFQSPTPMRHTSSKFTAGVGSDFQVIKDIDAMYRAEGKPVPKEQATSVYYNRGLMTAALHVEAIRNAIKAKGGAVPTSEEVKKGMEAIKDFALGGMIPPLQLSPEDHEGGGWYKSGR